MTMNDEEWRPTHHPLYDVSNYGRVRSWAGLGKHAGQRRRTPKILKGSCNAKGYPSVGFAPYGTRFPIHRNIDVHTLVAAAFLGPRPSGMETCHKDDNAANNHISNLEYATHSKNCIDARLNLKYPGNTKLTPEDVRQIRLLLTQKHRRRGLAEKFDVGLATIHAIATRRTWAYV